MSIGRYTNDAILRVLKSELGLKGALKLISRLAQLDGSDSYHKNIEYLRKHLAKEADLIERNK